MPSTPKILFLIADGMGDWPGPGDKKTPLAEAETPNMDALARHCCAGLIQTVPPGMAPGSDTANMALIGFDPQKHLTGRGPVEAAAQGLKLAPNDLVFRLNLVTVTEPNTKGLMLDYSAGHIDTAKSTELILDLREFLRKLLGGEDFALYPGVQYRHLLVLKKKADSTESRLHVRPPHDITGRKIAPDLETFERSPVLSGLFYGAARRLAAASNTTPANAVWPWGQGRSLFLPDFREAYGLKGAVISAVDLVKGLGRASRMTVLDVAGATGLLDTNYAGKVRAALDFLEQGDFVYLHVEAPDECGHAGNREEKIEAVARFDAQIVGPLRKALAERDVAFFITCDHLTPLREKTHVSDPVPFLLNHPKCREHKLSAFTEETAGKTGLFIDPGHTTLSWVRKKIFS